MTCYLYILPITYTYYLLPVTYTYYLLPITYTYYLLPVTYTYYLLPVTYTYYLYILPITCYLYILPINYIVCFHVILGIYVSKYTKTKAEDCSRLRYMHLGITLFISTEGISSRQNHHLGKSVSNYYQLLLSITNYP
jgi:hypothetical protein